jgi:hypothetical protein
VRERKNKIVSVVDSFGFKGFSFTVFYCEHNHLAVLKGGGKTWYVLFGGPYTPEKKKALISTRKKLESARLKAFDVIEGKEFDTFIEDVKKIRGE